ncbi:endo-1,4-beta-xylanase [Fodinibius salsisoli]|uniref:Beta-xylanase n=1 Tax=Fodinibius salsisoli TaxID=2820877 RepID=A0ABT3PKF5_9BACT|nr:endo-1,4-beta-xylanase [Fodinibius salsisoli]MCW9706411.1 endo-1,4-beta-xylanase [Fodinibius salsisoli]
MLLYHKISVIVVVFLFCGCQSQQSTSGDGNLGSLSKAYEKEFKVGVALNTSQVSGEIPEATSLIAKHFNSATPENLLKWESVHPREEEYNFDPADQYVSFAEKNDMFIVGHTLVWHNQVPGWVFEDKKGNTLSSDRLLQRMKEHISTVVGRYKGQIDGWDVVNEAVLDQGGMRGSPWYKILGTDYIAKAFEYAHAADSSAELYYNDYNLWKTEKRQEVIRLVKQLQAKDIPIQGIGMQAHLGLRHPPVSKVEESIEAFSKLGVKVMITELDIDVLPDEEEGATANSLELNPYSEGLPDSVQQKLTERYVELFKLFKKHSTNIDRVTFWGLNDGQSWLNNFPVAGRTNYPLLFDREYNPKPALKALIDLQH